MQFGIRGNMTISIYSKSLSKKLKPLPFWGRITPSECLKGFYFGTLKKEKGFVFLLGYFKEKVTKISIAVKFEYTGKLKQDVTDGYI